jgi:hypothetical protein
MEETRETFRFTETLFVSICFRIHGCALSALSSVSISDAWKVDVWEIEGRSSNS